MYHFQDKWNRPIEIWVTSLIGDLVPPVNIPAIWICICSNPILWFLVMMIIQHQLLYLHCTIIDNMQQLVPMPPPSPLFIYGLSHVHGVHPFYLKTPAQCVITYNIFISCLHCFGEGNFQTLDMTDVMTSGNKTARVNVVLAQQTSGVLILFSNGLSDLALTTMSSKFLGRLNVATFYKK